MREFYRPQPQFALSVSLGLMVRLQFQAACPFDRALQRQL